MTATERAQPQGRPDAPAHARTAPVVVGVDDSTGSMTALDWAAAEALSRGVALRIVHTWSWQMLEPWSSRVDHLAVGDLQHRAQTLVRRCLERARRQEGLEVTAEIDEGYPQEVLVRTGASAGLLVLGSHHLHALGRAVLGSVSSAVVARSSCPVVVLAGPAGLPAERPSVVVGIAGERLDERLLDFAFEHAARKRLPLKAILCWHPALGDQRMPPPEQAHLYLAESIAGWRERYPDVAVHTTVVRRHPADALVAASAAAELLVVGRHARRMRFGALLGSVSLGVLHHATCPVAVIPPGADD